MCERDFVPFRMLFVCPLFTETGGIAVFNSAKGFCVCGPFDRGLVMPDF